MKNLSIIFILLLILFISDGLQAQFTIDAQLRNRAEFCDGYRKLAAEGATPAFFNSQRTRLTFGFDSKNLKLKFTPQDVRIWGEEKNISFSGNNGEDASLDLYEGYAELKLLKSFWVSIGRQELSFDNQTLFSNGNWNQSGNTSDAVIWKFNPIGWNLQLVGSWNSNSLIQKELKNNFNQIDRYKSLNILWLNRKFSDNLSASFIYAVSGVTVTDTTNTLKFRQTSGLYANYKKENLVATADVYYQFGKSQKDLKVSALMFDAEVNYKLHYFTPSIGISYLSGNSEADANLKTDHLFDPLYRTRHTFFGGLDYFVKFNTDTKQGGLADIYLGFDFKLSKTINLKDSFHYFSLAQTNPNIPNDPFLGWENDLIFKYKFNEWGALEAGHLFFLPTETLKIIQGVPDNKFSQYVYIQLTLTPTLFKQAN